MAPEVSSELRITIMQHFIGQTKRPDNRVKEQGRDMLGGELSLPHEAWHKAHVTKYALYTSHYGVKATTKRQVGHKIYRPMTETSVRYRQRLQEPRGRLRAKDST